jgi:hypothetical protein
MDLNVDTGRLGQEAGTLGGQGSPLAQATDDLSTAVASALDNCGTVNDDGLRGALTRFGEAWGFEVAAIASDIAATSGVMSGLAQAYAQADSQGASALT